MKKAIFIFTLLSCCSSANLCESKGALSLAAAQKLLAEIGIVDGNVSLGIHANQVDRRKKTVTEKISYEERIAVARNQLHLKVMTWTVSSGLDSLKTCVAAIDENPDALVIRKAVDLDTAIANDQLAVMFYSQKHYPLQGNVERLEEFYTEGLRVFQIAYGGSNTANMSKQERLGAGGYDGNRRYRSKYSIDYKDFGLTRLGRLAVRKLNQLPMLIDVSHCHEDTIEDVAKLSKSPIIANHANAYALTSAGRNLSDKALKQIADSGGVVGAMLVGNYVDTDKNGADIHDYVRHVDYLVDLLGIDHVGVATDGYLNGWPKSSSYYAGPKMSSYDRWAYLIVELSKIKNLDGSDKYGERAYKKLLNENFLRVYRQVLAGNVK